MGGACSSPPPGGCAKSIFSAIPSLCFQRALGQVCSAIKPIESHKPRVSEWISPNDHPPSALFERLPFTWFSLETCKGLTNGKLMEQWDQDHVGPLPDCEGFTFSIASSPSKKALARHISPCVVWKFSICDKHFGFYEDDLNFMCQRLML